MRINFVKYIFLCLIMLLPACNDFVIKSSWKTSDIIIDGKDTEWQNKMIKYRNLYFSVCNDNEYMYICFAATDKKTKAQLMGLFKQNFTINFAAKKDSLEGSFGLRFSNESPFMDEILVGKIRYIKTPIFQVVAQEMMNNLEVEVLKNYYPVALLSQVSGIDTAASVSMNGRKLVYELKIPLIKTKEHPFAVEAEPGRPVYILLSASSVDKNSIFEQIVKQYNETGSNSKQKNNVNKLSMYDYERYYGIDPWIIRELESFQRINIKAKIKLSEN